MISLGTATNELGGTSALALWACQTRERKCSRICILSRSNDLGGHAPKKGRLPHWSVTTLSLSFSLPFRWRGRVNWVTSGEMSSRWKSFRRRASSKDPRTRYCARSSLGYAEISYLDATGIFRHPRDAFIEFILEHYRELRARRATKRTYFLPLSSR